MSGIYIKGMEMPKSCSVCSLFGEYGCAFIGAVGEALTRGERNEDCPLVPVPDHGRLIDADALMRHCVMMPRDGGRLPVVYASYVRNAPTIIPAADVVERKKGMWRYDEAAVFGNPYGSYRCSDCGNCVPHRMNFCGYCGADMRGEE